MKDWFSIRALPNQIVKVNKRWQLGNSPVALRVNYECPLDNLSNPLRAPARLMVRYGSLTCAFLHRLHLVLLQLQHRIWQVTPLEGR